MSEFDIDKIDDIVNGTNATLDKRNIIGAIVVGFVVAIIVSSLWAIITVFAERQWAYMAIGAGIVVGSAIKMFARFNSAIYGIIGAVFSLGACILGDFLTNVGFIAINENMQFFETLGAVDLSYFFEIAFLDFDFYSLIFYVIAVFIGYSLASNSNLK